MEGRAVPPPEEVQMRLLLLTVLFVVSAASPAALFAFCAQTFARVVDT